MTAKTITTAEQKLLLAVVCNLRNEVDVRRPLL